MTSRRRRRSRRCCLRCPRACWCLPTGATAGFPLWRRAAGTGADLLWRMKANLRLPVLERFDDGSYRSVLRGSGQDRRRSRGECPVRVVEYRLDDPERCRLSLGHHSARPGRRTRRRGCPRCITSAGKWRRPTMRSRPTSWARARFLRSKTPDLVLQEVHGLMLAHYAVRRLIYEAARKVDEDPDRLSFVHAVRVVRRRVENPGVSPPRLRMSGFATTCWTRFLKSAWSPVAARRSPAASSGR